MEKPKKPKIIRARFGFDDQNYVFDDTYPKELEGKLSKEEFCSVLVKINTELNVDLLQQKAKIKAVYKTLVASFWTVLGLLCIPYVIYQSEKQRAKLLLFNTRVKLYLETRSKETFRNKGFTWNLVVNEKEVDKNRPDERYWKIEVEISSYFTKAASKPTGDSRGYSTIYYETIGQGTKQKKKAAKPKGG